MPRKVIYENYRVEVEMDLFWVVGKEGTVGRHRNAQGRLSDLATQIRRHCDDVRVASPQWDEKPVCEFCGRPWTERKDDPHNGGCCDQDAANMPGEEPVTQTERTEL